MALLAGRCDALSRWVLNLPDLSFRVNLQSVNGVVVMIRDLLRFCFFFYFAGLAGVNSVAAEAPQQCVRVTAAFLELHTGPAEVYPVTQIVERNQQVCVVKRRTNWIKLTGERKREGWAHQDQLLAATDPAAGS
ncbi:MAG: hypothetical protein ACR2QG_04595 [Gammaproteobacteria bacterium]